MKNDEAAVAVIDALESLQIPYMVVGSLASNLYGIPRMTLDADFVLQIKASAIGKVVERLGPQFRLDPQMSFEMVTGSTRFVLQAAETPFKIEFFLLTEDPYDQDRFARRRRLEVLGREATVSTAEDVVVTKLRWWKASRRTKDLQDARGVIAVRGNGLDWAYVDSWCDRHGTRDTLEQLRRSTPNC